MKIEKYNVCYTELCKSSADSMPLGNGDIGLNVWTEENGLLMYLSKNDAWDETVKLLKLGRIRIEMNPNPFPHFLNQTLNLKNGEIIIETASVKIKVFADANHPVIRVETEAKEETEITVTLETWRNERYLIPNTQVGDVYKNLSGPDIYPTVQDPDTIVDTKDNTITWYHYNHRSAYFDTLRLQGLSSLADKYPDPLLNRIFGGIVYGDGFVSVNPKILKKQGLKAQLNICLNTLLSATPETWLAETRKTVKEIQQLSPEETYKLHCKWWQDFFDRSYIVSNQPELYQLTQGYLLQRFMNACASRGRLPIKFNGSLFTMDDNIDQNPDFRQWGQGFWFQNTRLIYWPMLESGDYDLMMPFFRMYKGMLEFAKDRNQLYYHHGGAHLAETPYFFGPHVNAHYGWNRERQSSDYVECPYVRYYWQGGIELTLMMLEYFEYTLDFTFAKDYLIPMAKEIILFYDLHFGRDEAGKILFSPSQSLETWHTAKNPLPEIAGFKFVINQLLQLETVDETQKTEWQRFLNELPEIPIGVKNGIEVILPAETYSDRRNYENPELYAIFPYRLYGLGKEKLDLALRTFHERDVKNHFCWHQDDIQAALLGLTEEVKGWVTERASAKAPGCRFPAFWDKGWDWIPDMDHGGVMQKALEYMLIQCDGDQITLFPAWPKEWNVEFKLHAPKNTVIKATLENGSVMDLRVFPENRKKDIHIYYNSLKK